MKIKIDIKSWYGSVLFSYEKEENTLRHTLENAVLRGAVLTGAVLTGAVLTGADLTDADLTDADLTDAVLTDADLRGADLTGAVLRGADLTDAVLTPIKADFYLILINAIPEVQGLRKAITSGNINGSTYSGDCACLVGTIANIKHCNYTKIKGIVPDSSRPAEKFFMGIKKGDTPENSEISRIVVSWIDEFLNLVNPRIIQK